MKYSTRLAKHKTSNASLLSTLKLAYWQLRQTWGLLLITGVGIVAAIMLVCAVPLYARVAMSAGLRGILNASPQNAEIAVRGGSNRISSPVIKKVSQELDQEFGKYLGHYLSPPQFSIETPPYYILPPKPLGKGPHVTNDMELVSAPTDQASAHLELLQGRLPLSTSKNLELAITPETAAALKITPGSTLNVSIEVIDANQVIANRELKLHIVGIFKLISGDDPFWHGIDFTIYQPNDFVSVFTGLVSHEAALSTFTRSSDEAASSGQFLFSAVSVNWYYRLIPAHVSIDDLDTILNGIDTVKVDNGNNADLEQSPFLSQTSTYQQSDMLVQYSDRASVAQLPITSLLVLMLGLVLFFVSIMVDLLVDRQANAIAILRSRGASRRQVFSSLMVQCLSIGLLSLIIGPVLTQYLVRFLALHSLSVADQGALNLVASNPVQGALGLSGYALLAVIAAILAMSLAIFQATQRDILLVRREAARSTRSPLWIQLNLDIIAVLITLVGYGISSYFINTGVLDAHLRLLLLSPLSLLESAFLLIASTLIFLRFFPRILRIGTWLALRGRSAAPMLALAQMARSPHQAVRMTLLLALTTAFAIFTLIFTASQSQRILDVATFQSGADFSGGFSGNILTAAQMAHQTRAYKSIRGITSVSLGYTTPATAAGTLLSLPINFTAVDPSTFAQTANWTSQNSSQPLSSLMAQLTTQRASAATRQSVPAIVDENAWNTLHLSQGASFSINFASDSYNNPVHFTVIAKVQHIPTGVNSTLPGIMVDFFSYTTVYAHTSAQFNFIVPLNYVWLRTRNDAASLASVRKALSQGDLQLDPLYDRRALVDTLYHEPLYLSLTGILALGATTALLLALVGNLIASWLIARQHMANFAILRALGASPGQVISTLTWEQGIIYATALGLGLLFGALFSFLVIPSLVFTSVAPSDTASTGNISASTFYGIQSIPPIQIVVPTSLVIALALLIITCIGALAMIIRIVSRPSISQLLRLNKD